MDFSDHLNYWTHDIPAVMIIDTAFFRNQNYHTKKDTVDTLNLNLNKMKDVVDGVVLTILSLD
nr:M28 family peptidase [Acinetobacter sp. TGL-Y2]